MGSEMCIRDRFSPEETGEHQVIMTCRENGSTLETTISVQGAAREKLGQPANFEVLSEIAKITRGKMVKAEQIREIFAALSELPEPEAKIKRIRLWADPRWAGLLVLMLATFWVGRKMVGKV